MNTKIDSLTKHILVRILKEFGIYKEFVYEVKRGGKRYNIPALDLNETWLQGIDKLLWWDETQQGTDFWYELDKKMTYVDKVFLRNKEIQPLLNKLILLTAKNR